MEYHFIKLDKKDLINLFRGGGISCFTKGTQEKEQQLIGIFNCILPGIKP